MLERLDDAALETLLQRAEAEEGRALPLDDDARAGLCGMADGDGRFVLNLAEELLALAPGQTVLISSDACEDQIWRASEPLRDIGVRVVRLYAD